MSASENAGRASTAPCWQKAVVCLALAGLVFAVFGQTLRDKFVDYDDGVYVTDNSVVLRGLTRAGVVRVFTREECGFYHPLTMLSLMADHQFYDLKPGGYHLTNVLLHAGSAVLLFLALCAMTGALWPSAGAAAVFAVHPLHVESVAWVAERKDVLSGFFFMLTLCVYVFYSRKSGSVLRYLAVVLVFVMALLCKPTVVTLPVVLLLLDYWPLRRTESARRLIVEKIPLLVLSLTACVVAVLMAKSALNDQAPESPAFRIQHALISYFTYIRQSVWPSHLAAFYPKPPHGWPWWQAVGALLLLALVTGTAWVRRQKTPWFLMGWLCYLVMLLPMCGLMPTGAYAHADRMSYLPQIGLGLVVSWWLTGVRAGRAVGGGLMAGIIIGLTVVAWRQAAVWRDSLALWTHSLACTPDNYVAEGNYGIALRDSGRLDEAVLHYNKAVEFDPNYAPAYYNLGNALYEQGKFDEAAARYRTALKISPTYAEAHYNFGSTLYAQNRLDDAIAEFQTALRLRPRYEEAENNLGIALLQKDDIDSAMPHFRAAMELKPAAVSPRFNLGLALLRKGSVDASIAAFQEALKIKPDYAAAHANLGTAYLHKGAAASAIQEYKTALKIDPADEATRSLLEQATAAKNGANRPRSQ